MGGEPQIKDVLMFGRHWQGRCMSGDVIPKIRGQVHLFHRGQFVHFLSKEGIHGAGCNASDGLAQEFDAPNQDASKLIRGDARDVANILFLQHCYRADGNRIRAVIAAFSDDNRQRAEENLVYLNLTVP